MLRYWLKYYLLIKGYSSTCYNSRRGNYCSKVTWQSLFGIDNRGTEEQEPFLEGVHEQYFPPSWNQQPNAELVLPLHNGDVKQMCSIHAHGGNDSKLSCCYTCNKCSTHMVDSRHLSTDQEEEHPCQITDFRACFHRQRNQNQWRT